MQRKLIKQGGGGYTIYLPKKWLDKKGFKAGDEIEISESDSSLIIGSAVKENTDITVTITPENKEDVKNILTHLYRKGFVKITLNSINPALLKEVKSITNNLLLGFELTEKTNNSCTIENISEPTGEKYEVILRKIFFIINEMIGEIKNDFENNNYKGKTEIDDMKKQQDKLILFCRRLLIKEKYDKNQALSWELLTFLMHISHALHYFYAYSEKNKIKKDAELTKLLNSLEDYFELFSQAYHKKEIENIHKINSLKNKYHFGTIPKLIETSKTKNAVAYSYLRETFRLIQIGTSPILAMILKY